jgi:hypothetical protein
MGFEPHLVICVLHTYFEPETGLTKRPLKFDNGSMILANGFM